MVWRHATVFVSSVLGLWLYPTPLSPTRRGAANEPSVLARKIPSRPSPNGVSPPTTTYA